MTPTPSLSSRSHFPSLPTAADTHHTESSNLAPCTVTLTDTVVATNGAVHSPHDAAQNGSRAGARQMNSYMEREKVLKTDSYDPQLAHQARNYKGQLTMVRGRKSMVPAANSLPCLHSLSAGDLPGARAGTYLDRDSDSARPRVQTSKGRWRGAGSTSTPPIEVT